MSSDLDSISTFSMIDYLHEKIIGSLEHLLQRSDLKENLAKLEKLEGLGMAKSSDNKLFNFTLFAKNGGSYRMYLSTMHYIADDPKYQDYHTFDRSGIYSVFNSDGYDRIEVLQTEMGTKYLLFGQIRGCSSCFTHHATLFSYKDGVFREDFSLKLELRNYETAIEYNEKEQTLSVNYTTDDFTQFCLDADEYVPDGEYEEKECSCVYKFNGYTFQLVED